MNLSLVDSRAQNSPNTDTDSHSQSSTLLIYAPVPLHQFEDALYAERQAINGLRLWATHFDRVIVMMPLVHDKPPKGWLPVQQHSAALERVAFDPLPSAYRPDHFLRALSRTRAKIRENIKQANYLSFAIGGLFGDWGAVSAIEANRMGRKFAVWTDRVESEVERGLVGTGPWKRRLRAFLSHRAMSWLERYVIRRADLGLFHGKETYEAYSALNRNPHIVHDIHITAEDHIPANALAVKASCVQGGPLRIVYVGRADWMKGPIDWIAALERLNVQGVNFRATWLGEGEELAQMQARVARSGLAEKVFLPGFVSNRGEVMRAIRDAHVMMFCHKTPESPRNLIESLCNGTPIVGYDGAFAQDLIAQHNGGVLVPQGDTEMLTYEIMALANDRGRLARMITQARLDGAPFTDEKVFEHRSQVIKEHLPWHPGG